MKTDAAAERKPAPKISVAGLAFAMTAFAAAFLGSGKLLNGDGDLLRHLVIGRYILGHGPRFADPFSFSRAGAPFLAYEWISQVAYAGAEIVAGLPGVVALAALLIAGAVALVVSNVRRGGDPWLATITGAAAALVSYPYWYARPHLFTFVAVAGLPLVLESRRRLLWLVPFFALWANLHPGFLYGLVMVAVWCAGEALDGDIGRRGAPLVLHAAAPFAVAAAATLVNPFGWALHAHAIRWAGDATVRNIAEFRPLIAIAPEGVVFMAVTGLLIVGLAARKEWVGWKPLLVTGVAFFAALAVTRNAPLFAFFAMPVLARSLTPVVEGLPHRFLGGMRAEFSRSDAPGWRLGAAAGAVLVAVLIADGRTRRITLVPDEFSADVFPAAAVAYARDAGLDGRLFSEYAWGGYVLYAWPGQRVFVDSMADFFGAELVREYGDIISAKPGWRELLDEHGISVILVRPDATLVEALSGDRDWHVAHRDAVAVVIVKNEPKEAANGGG